MCSVSRNGTNGMKLGRRYPLGGAGLKLVTPSADGKSGAHDTTAILYILILKVAKFWLMPHVELQVKK